MASVRSALLLIVMATTFSACEINIAGNRPIGVIWLRGSVVSSETGEPVEGVQVGFLYCRNFLFCEPRSPRYSDPTGADGMYDHQFDPGSLGWACSQFPSPLVARADSISTYQVASLAAVLCTEEPQVFNLEKLSRP